MDAFFHIETYTSGEQAIVRLGTRFMATESHVRSATL